MFSLRKTLKNSKTISIFTLLSRILGFVRDLLIASHLGASVYTDMFFIAFRIPNSLRRFLGEGAINSSVVPVLSKIEEKEKPKAIFNLIFYFCVVLLIITVLGIVASKLLMLLFAGGYINSPYSSTMNSLIKLIFPYLFFVGLYVLLMGILNSYEHFAIPSFAPALLNVSLIAAVLLLLGKFKNPAYALVVGVLIGGVLQVLVSLIDFLSLRLPFRFSLKLEKSTKEIFSLTTLTALGSSASQISSMVDSFVASFLQAGSFTYLFYANRLFQLPFAVFSIAITQSSLPSLSKIEKEKIPSAVEVLLKFMLFLSIGVEIYFIVFADKIIEILFMHGKFSLTDTLNTALALKIMMVSFIFYSFSKILNNAFYSLKDAKTPLRVSVISSIAAIISSLSLGFWLGFVGLAISTAITGFINCIALLFYIPKKIGRIRLKMIIDRFIALEFVLLAVLSIIAAGYRFGFIVVIPVYLAFLIYGIKRFLKEKTV
ncbi:murein biosynthesis integral membrane protein MurJ [Hippea alviniae]|uniref:murein biosynthesis integral membrane protein MurJ n=1 Tax=Hippea alviniae TaxID=1279027 RepID=UPI0003B40ED2|nr:murein biosynthesis integral membrane protein MurJ [Hippea alviniae]